MKYFNTKPGQEVGFIKGIKTNNRWQLGNLKRVRIETILPIDFNQTLPRMRCTILEGTTYMFNVNGHAFNTKEIGDTIHICNNNLVLLSEGEFFTDSYKIF